MDEIMEWLEVQLAIQADVDGEEATFREWRRSEDAMVVVTARGTFVLEVREAD